jgi:hypothetical protein
MNSLGKSLSRNTLCLVIYVTITVFDIKRPKREKEKGGQGQNRESHWALPMSSNFLIACFSGLLFFFATQFPFAFKCYND